jgi:hypothetical protein
MIGIECSWEDEMSVKAISVGVIALVLMLVPKAIAGAAFNTLPVCSSPSSVILMGTAASTGPQLSGELFNYGTTTAYGQTQQATCGAFTAGVATCTATLTGLQPNTVYHYQFYGTFQGCGKSTCTEGSDMTFKTCPQ